MRVEENEWAEFECCDNVWPYSMPLCPTSGVGSDLGVCGGIREGLRPEELNKWEGKGPGMCYLGVLCCICRTAHSEGNKDTDQYGCVAILPHVGDCVCYDP